MAIVTVVDFLHENARLAAEFHKSPRVLTQSGLGWLTSLDIEKECGVGVRVDYIDGRGNNVISHYSAGSVRLFSEYKEALMQLFRGVTWDGNLVSKAHRDILVELRLAARSDGFNLITAAGVAELRKSKWIHQDGTTVATLK